MRERKQISPGGLIRPTPAGQATVVCGAGLCWRGPAGARPAEDRHPGGVAKTGIVEKIHPHPVGLYNTSE